MKLRSPILSFAPMLAGNIDQLIATKWPEHKASLPAGTRIGYDSLVGVLDLEYTLPFRQRLARMAADDSIRGIALYFNSPGGTVEGTAEAAEVMRRAALVKPVHVVAEGFLCSACYHIACQATTISAAPSTVVGSIGTIISLVDDSEAFAAAGFKVLAITTGINKGVGYPGVPVAEEHVAMLSRLVESHQQDFEVSVLRGRKLNAKQLTDVSDGSVWTAARAKKLGLIDFVALPEDRFAEIEAEFPAELYTSLRGYEASQKFDELVMARAKVEWVEDAPASAVKQLRSEFPALAAAAAEYESTNSRNRSR